MKDKGKTVFQSSLDQVEDFSKYETGETIDFDYDADSVEDDFEYSSSVKPQLARSRVVLLPLCLRHASSNEEKDIRW